MISGWLLPMFAAGACSAGAIVLLRELPRVAPGIPVLLTVALYMLLGGFVLLAVSRLDGAVAVTWPQTDGMIRITAIGVLLGALEAFFVMGGRNAMPLPDAMIVYNLTSLALVTLAGVLMFGETITLQRMCGLALGLLSLLILLQPARSV